MAYCDWLGLKEELPEGTQNLLAVLSFALPALIWCAVSYLPWVWHPLVKITDVGSVDYFVEDMQIPRAEFARQVAKAEREGGELPKGYRVNPVYLPAPHEVVRAFYTAFTTPPRLQNEPWLHQSLGHSIRTILLGFLASSVLGVPLGILCGAYRFFSKLQEPFIEFFRYLPAPAFGALCVAILGIDDGPKIAIIFIGTFFQQVLVIANTVRKVDPTLIEAAQTLGARGWRLVSRVVIPATITDIYTDMRILLGWAWTYLIVAEVVGTMSGITFFINQQARFRNFDNVYAAIMMIGIIGLTSDVCLAWLGTKLFPWKRRRQALRVAIARALANEPRILIMDEPFGALDAQTRAQMQNYLLQIWKMVDVTILFITHDLDEAVYLSDRVMVLGANPGRVVELIENPVPRPHSPAQFTAPEYLALKARLEHLIHPHVEVPEEKLPVGRLTRAGDDVE